MHQRSAKPVTSITILFCLAAFIGRADLAHAQGSPPLPAPGQTVVWDVSLSPVVINGTQVIPAGGTVEVEAGVLVQVQSNSTLEVRGSLIGLGTPSQPVTLQGATVAGSLILGFGTVDLTNGVVRCQTRARRGGALIYDSCVFEGNGHVTTFGIFNATMTLPPYINMNQCTFQGGATLFISGCSVVMTDTLFQNTWASLSGYDFIFDNVTIDGSPFQGLSLSSGASPVYLDGVTVLNSAEAGLDLFTGNYEIGPDVVLQNNLYPASAFNGGLLPGSSLPATGNVNNFIWVPDDGDRNQPVTWADSGIPYVVEGSYTLFGGHMEVLPGATIQLMSGATIRSDPGPVFMLGTASEPITLERFDPALPWATLNTLDRLQYCNISGATVGSVWNGSFGHGWATSCTYENNGTAVSGFGFVEGSRFTGNDVAADLSGSIPGLGNPNRIAGNTSGVTGALDATHNWWGDPSGPASPANPGGMGDSAGPGIPVLPFLSVEPDPSNEPPEVKVYPIYWVVEAGDKVMLNWRAQDDGGIVSQKILFSEIGDLPQDFTEIASDLPAGQRAYEWTVPDVGFQFFSGQAHLRVVAVDGAGLEGWDQVATLLPSNEVDGSVTFNTDLSGPFPAGTPIGDFCYTAFGNAFTSQVLVFVLDDSDFSFASLGGGSFGSSCLPLGWRTPPFSTDTARMTIGLVGTANRQKWFFSEPFTIRRDPRMGDGAPEITMTSPAAGQSFGTGGIVPITWTATDDQALRSFNIQASYDGGRTWHFVVQDLPATATSYDWPVAPGTGFDDVRVRVIARDLRFNSTADGNQSPFQITPGGPGPQAFIRGDSNGSGDLDISDMVGILTFLFAGAGTSCPTALDFNDDDGVDLGDAISGLTYLFNSGAPPAPPFPACGTEATPGALDCQAFAGCP